MTPEERDRLTVVETKTAAMQTDIKEIKAMLTQLVDAANMGRGAWFLLLKLGGAIVILGSFITWVLDHIKT